jgi:hypothetical protein
MERYAPVAKDLASRDVVSRSMTIEIREGVLNVIKQFCLGSTPFGRKPFGLQTFLFFRKSILCQCDIRSHLFTTISKLHFKTS